MDLWDRLAGTMQIYVENYIVSKQENLPFNIQPSFEVKYEIPNVEELITFETLDEYWLHKIASCKNINDLPGNIKRLVCYFLPCFFKQYPQYKKEECLIPHFKSEELEINSMVKVRYLWASNPLMLLYGKVYDARILKLGWFGIVDETHEEYAYPPYLFELIEE